MRNTVAPRHAKPRQAKATPQLRLAPLAASGLYTGQGARKYLTQGERQRVLAALDGPLSDAELLALTLAWTGARVSEALALTADSFQLDGNVIAIRTLKRRRPVVREVPVPAALIAALETRFAPPPPSRLSPISSPPPSSISRPIRWQAEASVWPSWGSIDDL